MIPTNTVDHFRLRRASSHLGSSWAVDAVLKIAILTSSEFSAQFPRTSAAAYACTLTHSMLLWGEAVPTPVPALLRSSARMLSCGRPQGSPVGTLVISRPTCHKCSADCRSTRPMSLTRLSLRPDSGSVPSGYISSTPNAPL